MTIKTINATNNYNAVQSLQPQKGKFSYVNTSYDV